MHLAEFNFGTLAYPWGDPRISGFETAEGTGQASQKAWQAGMNCNGMAIPK